MVIFHSYVDLPEGNPAIKDCGSKNQRSEGLGVDCFESEEDLSHNTGAAFPHPKRLKRHKTHGNKNHFFLRNQRRTLVWDDPWNNHLEIIKNSHGGDSLGYYSPVTSFFCWHPESIDAELFIPSGTKRTMTLTCHELLFNRHVKS